MSTSKFNQDHVLRGLDSEEVIDRDLEHNLVLESERGRSVLGAWGNLRDHCRYWPLLLLGVLLCATRVGVASVAVVCVWDFHEALLWLLHRSSLWNSSGRSHHSNAAQVLAREVAHVATDLHKRKTKNQKKIKEPLRRSEIRR